MAVSKMLHQKFGTKKGSKWREMELGSAWHLQTLVLVLRAQHDSAWEVQHSSSPALEFRDFLYIPVYCLVMFGVYFPPWCKLLLTAATFVTCLQLVQRELRLHGKRRIERRRFFQPLWVHFLCVFSGFFAFVHFLDPFKSCDKLLRFCNVLSVSVHFFVSQAWQDVS